jgi:hypothetical protein
MNLQDVQDIAIEMMRNDRVRDELFEACEKAVNCDWDFPAELSEEHKEQLRKIVKTDAQDAVRSTQRALSENVPQFRIKQLSAGSKRRKQLDKWEKAIRWMYELAEMRGEGNITETLTWDAPLYSTVAGRVIYLPHEIEARKAFGGNTDRLEQAERYGPFVIELYNPRYVHVKYSDWMPEAILLKQVRPISEIIDFWGDKAEGLKTVFKNEEGDLYDFATVYDYATLEKRWVWLELNDTEDRLNPTEGKAEFVLMDGEDTGLTFQPWFARYSGTKTAPFGTTKEIPMLKSVIESKQWEDANMYATFLANRVIALHYRAVWVGKYSYPPTGGGIRRWDANPFANERGTDVKIYRSPIATNRRVSFWYADGYGKHYYPRRT